MSSESMSFDEWLDSTKLRGYVDENSLEASFEAGAQSRQAEIDELQKTVNKLKNNRMYLEVAISSARDGADEDFDLFLNYLSNILKGKEK